MKAAFAVALLMPAIVIAATLGPDAKVLRIDSGTTVRLCMDCAPQRVRFQVTVLNEAGKVEITRADTPRVIGVSTSGARLDTLESHFKASWEPSAGEPRTLVLTIDPPLREPGTYDVMLNLLPVTRPRAPNETVQVIASAATLQGPDKLLVHRTNRWPFPPEIRSTPLVVSEAGRVTGVKTLNLTSMPFAHDSQPIGGTIVADWAAGTGLTIMAGESETIPYHISGEFPLGLSSGSVRLSALETTAVLAIPVEVRSQLSRVYLALVIIGGLLLSWQVKVVLHRRLQANQARAAAATLLIEVEIDRSDFPDDDFQRATEQPLKALKALTEQAKADDAEAIEKARTALDAAWRTARQELEKARIAFRTQLDAWQKLVSLEWEVAPSLTPVLNTARGAVAAAATLDQNGKVTEAKTTLDNAQAQTAGDLQKVGRSWQLASRRFFNELFAAEAGISDAILLPLKAASDSWRVAYGDIEPAPTRDPAAVLPLLRRITDEYVTTRDHLRELPRHLRREFEEVSGDLEIYEADSSLIATIRDRLTTLEGTLSAAVDEPHTAVASLYSTLVALQRAWADGFENATTTQPDKVREHVARRDFRGAARWLGGASNLAAGQETSATRLDQFTSGLASVPGPPRGAFFASGLPPASPYAALLLESRSGIRHAKLLQTLIVGGMFFVWAMSTSSATFDGTVRSLLTALFSAFGLDVGIDALLARVKGTALG